MDSCSPPADVGRWAAGRRLYVDDDPGCEGHSPCFASLDGALGAVKDGDTISFLSGTYAGSLIRQTMSLQNLRLTSEQGSGSTTISGTCFSIIGDVPATGEIWVDHLTFRDCGPSTSNIEDGWGVFVDTFAGVAVRVQDNVFMGNNGGGAVSLFSGTVTVQMTATIARNYMLDNRGEAAALDIELPYDGGEVYCIRIENNVLARNRTGITFGYAPSSTKDLARFEFVNNTFVRNQVGVKLPGRAPQSRWFNNVFFGNDSDLTETAELTDVYDFRNNLIEGGVRTGLDGNFTADPLFQGTDDFHLRAGSPAAARGTEYGAPLDDVTGALRALPPDVGAYALVQGGASASVVHCGDGVIQRGAFPTAAGVVLGYETCDDGNTQGGDGCSSHCQFEAGPPRHQISEQSGNLCALRSDYSLSCWGAAAANMPQGAFKNVAMSAYHFCALRTDGTLSCWQSSGGTLNNVPSDNYRQIASDYTRTCALRMDGSIDCWGDSGPLRNYPGNFVEVSVAGRVCGLTASGQPFCFDPYVPELPLGPFVQFIPSLGPDWCALDRTGKLTCVGDDRLLRAATPFFGGLISLHTADGFACGIRPDGRAICWSDFGSFLPPQDQVFIEVTAGFDRGCGLTPDYRVHCWGDPLDYPRE